MKKLLIFQVLEKSKKNMSIHDINEATGIDEPNIQYHLNSLYKSGIIEKTKVPHTLGNGLFYLYKIKGGKK